MRFEMGMGGDENFVALVADGYFEGEPAWGAGWFFGHVTLGMFILGW